MLEYVLWHEICILYVYIEMNFFSNFLLKGRQKIVHHIFKKSLKIQNRHNYNLLFIA